MIEHEMQQASLTYLLVAQTRLIGCDPPSFNLPILVIKRDDDDLL